MQTPECQYFDAGQCRSCALLGTPYATQLQHKEQRCREVLTAVPETCWLPPVASAQREFRNKAKLVVGGDASAITLGILGPDGEGVDLRECMIQSAGIRGVIPNIASVIAAIGIVPYSVPRRRGELKFVHLTESPDGEFLLRFVVRSELGVQQLRAQLSQIIAAVPRAAVITVNVLPEHKAVLEGEREEVLLGDTLDMRFGEVSLHLLPQSFFQTNTAVAQQLYAQAAQWITDRDPASLWDLYCGVGGFALHCATRVSEPGADSGSGAATGGAATVFAPAVGAGAAVAANTMIPTRCEAGLATQRRVLGVELSAAAVDAARRSAAEAGIRAEFIAADVTAFVSGGDVEEMPEAVVVNPPRRGIGEALASWLDRSSVDTVVYSSCNPESLARDLTAMPAFTVVAARLFDMFPHTRHSEVMLLLRRVTSSEEE